MDIKALYKQGYSIRQIAKMSGLARNSVRGVLREERPKVFSKPQRNSKLDEFKPYITQRYQECGLSAVRLLSEIEPMGYKGSVDQIRRFIRGLNPLQKAIEKMTVRFETPAGQQAQVDWAYAGRFYTAAGKEIAIYIFVCVLSFSRFMYIEFTTSMDLPTLLNCHLHAFEYFNGWPQSILYDNMKQVRLSQQQFNPLLLDFANYYGLEIKTHRVRRPRTKGKVERMVNYVKDNFLNGRRFADLRELNAQGINWLEKTANVRIHATTQARPIDLLVKENLTAYNTIAPYQIYLKANRKVSAESFVHLAGSRYSVPPQYVGREVLVEQHSQQIRIRCNNLIVAEHVRATKAGACIVDPEHIAQLWQLSLAQPAPTSPHWQVSFSQAVANRDLTIYEEAAQ